MFKQCPHVIMHGTTCDQRNKSRVNVMHLHQHHVNTEKYSHMSIIITTEFDMELTGMDTRTGVSFNWNPMVVEYSVLCL